MKLRVDLLEHLTAEDILEEVLAQNSRYKAEPLFNKTGKGYLRPATQEERAAEIARGEARIAKLKQRSEESKQHRKA